MLVASMLEFYNATAFGEKVPNLQSMVVLEQTLSTEVSGNRRYTPSVALEEEHNQLQSQQPSWEPCASLVTKVSVWP